MTQRFLTFISTLVTAAALYAGGNVEAHSDEDVGQLPAVEAVNLQGRRLMAVATNNIVGDVVQNVAGDIIDLTILMKPGQNPHAYSPSPRDLMAMDAADIIFVNGLGLEGELLQVVESLENAVIVPVSAGLESRIGESHDEHDVPDPHFWFSPIHVIHWSESIARTLSSADPDRSQSYEAGRDAYIARLKELDADVRDMVASVPLENRKIVVDHAALGYYADEYGFEVLGNLIPSISDQAEISPRQVAELADEVDHENIQAIFVGGTAGRGLLNLAEAVSEESGRPIPVLTILTGSLASPGKRGDDYIDFIRFNTETIVAALGGSAE